MDHTFYIIKPEALQHADKIRQRIEESELEIRSSSRIAFTEEDVSLLAQFDEGYMKDSKLFEAYKHFLRQGVAEVGVISGEDAVTRYEALCGTSPDPQECEPDSLRATFGLESAVHEGTRFFLNGVHKSASDAEAAYELSLYEDIFYARTAQKNCEELARRFYEQPHEHTHPAYTTELISLWQHHVLPVKDTALTIAEELGGDRTVLEIASYFHDVARIIGDDAEHHKTSSEIAASYLEDLACPPEMIEQVKGCIYSHRGSVESKRGTTESEILACADGIATIQFWPLVLYSSYAKHKEGIDEGVRKAQIKLDKAWKKVLPETEYMIHDTYVTIKNTLQSMLQ